MTRSQNETCRSAQIIGRTHNSATLGVDVEKARKMAEKELTRKRSGKKGG